MNKDKRKRIKPRSQVSPGEIKDRKDDPFDPSFVSNLLKIQGDKPEKITKK